MQDPLGSIVANHGVVILDGALATELERRGLDLNTPLWSAAALLDAPALIAQVHTDYFEAGADVAVTASYQASFAGLADYGLDPPCAAELIESSVLIAREARDAFWAVPAHRVGRARPLVAASVGPYGAHLHDGSEYRGDYGLTVDALVEFHQPRLEALARAQPDVLACETIPSLAEAEALATALAAFPQLAAWATFSCRDDRHVCHGESVLECVAAAEAAGNVVGVGVNCTPPRFVPELVSAVAAHTSRHVVAYPNGGEVWDGLRQCWQARAGEAPVDFALEAAAWYARGARMIGGCCQTTPDTIRRLGDRVRALARSEAR